MSSCFSFCFEAIIIIILMFLQMHSPEATPVSISSSFLSIDHIEFCVKSCATPFTILKGLSSRSITFALANPSLFQFINTFCCSSMGLILIDRIKQHSAYESRVRGHCVRLRYAICAGVDRGPVEIL
jgi:hypothetical protein